MREERDALRVKLQHLLEKIEHLVNPEQPCGPEETREETIASAAERAAATVMHEALARQLAETPPPTPLVVPASDTTQTQAPTEARLGGPNGMLCGLHLTPTQLVFFPMQCDTEFSSIPLSKIEPSEIDDEELSSSRVVLSLALATGQSLTLDFGSTGAALVAAARFEADLRKAIDRAAVAAPSEPARRESSRVRQGHELRLTLQKVSRLKQSDVRKAQQTLDAVASGKQPSSDLINKRAFELATHLFSFGSLELTRAVLDKFLRLRDVMQLLPEAVLKTRADVTDAKTAKELLATAKVFFMHMMSAASGKTGGRRTDEEMNAYWVSAAALIPRNVFESRHGRAAARLLGIPYRSIKRASAIRGQLEDKNLGCALFASSLKV